jgi:hypothetical protein
LLRVSRGALKSVAGATDKFADNIKPPRWWGSFPVNPMDQALVRQRQLQPRRWGGRIYA